jgi:hypothetical protein
MNTLLLLFLLVGIPLYIFTSSLLHLFGTESSRKKKERLFVSAFLTVPWPILGLGAAASPKGDIAYTASILIFFFGPIVTFIALFFFVPGHPGAGWKKEILAVVFGLAMTYFFFAPAN